jgi:hypothetical protein
VVLPLLNKTNMKNEVIVLLDTESEQQIQIGKSAPVSPSTFEELSEMMLLDMATLCEALIVLIKEVDKEGVKPKNESLESCMGHLKLAFEATHITSSPGLVELSKAK